MFEEFVKQVKSRFTEICKYGKLFKVRVEGSLFLHYLNSYEDGTNEIFRDPTSSEHNCNTCHNFIKRYGNVVSIDENGNIVTMFGNLKLDKEYQVVADKLDILLKSSQIENVFFETFDELNSLPYEKCSKSNTIFKLGIDKNFKQYNKEEVEKFGVVTEGKVYTFHHLHIDLPTQFVDKSGKSIGAIEGIYRDKYSVFKRAMEEIPLDTLLLVKDLINQGSLLDGNTHVPVLDKIIEYKRKYDTINFNKDIALWVMTYDIPESIAKFKNHLIGVLCTELAEGKELNEACKTWNIRVDPVNYNKAKAPITQAQINLAKKFVEENGYSESFNRRLATIDDIKASEILHINRDNSKVKPVSMFDGIKTPSGIGKHKRSEFDKVEEVSIDKFMSDILPTCTNVEVLLENRMEGNLVNLTTSAESSKQIFKWNNPFSYTFNGNLAGKSQIKENVKAVGGKIDGILRCSLQWNDNDTKGMVDFDLHCKTPATEIMYNNKKDHLTGGWLDVDMINPSSIGIENITWQTMPKNGKYHFFNRNFNSRQNTGFKIEIEFNGEVYNYHYSGNAQGDIKIATISVNNGIFTIEHHLPETSSSKQLWGIDSNQFHKVNLVCLTPNHWKDNGIGNKHYLFMLQGCKNPNQVRGFHNEHLVPELLQHRKVLDVLGNTVLCEPIDNQLAGIGFNATIKDEIILRLSGSHKRIVKVKF